MKLLLSGKNIIELVVEAKKFIQEVQDLEFGGDYDEPTDNPTPTPEPELPTVTAPHSPNFGATESTDVDHRGVRWDGRIHSDSKAINKDGSWRTRRGVEPSLVYKLEAEQRAPTVAAQPVVPSIPTPVVAPISQPVPVAPPIALPPMNIIAQAPVAPPPLPVPQPVTLAHTVASFTKDIVRVLAELVRQGKLTEEYINALKNYFKIDEIWQVDETQAAQMFEQFVTAKLLTKVG